MYKFWGTCLSFLPALARHVGFIMKERDFYHTFDQGFMYTSQPYVMYCTRLYVRFSKLFFVWWKVRIGNYTLKSTVDQAHADIPQVAFQPPHPIRLNVLKRP